MKTLTKNEIEKMMKEHGFTQTEIANIFGVHRGTISKLLNSKIKSYTIGCKKRLVDREINVEILEYDIPRIVDSVLKSLQKQNSTFECDNIRDFITDWIICRDEDFCSKIIDGFAEGFIFKCLKKAGQERINFLKQNRKRFVEIDFLF